MDASAGQRKPGVVNWRGVEEPKDQKKKKAHWLVAKEAGKRVNGSQKRKKRRLDRDEAVQDAPEMSKKPRPSEREAATSVVLKSPQEQRDYLWSELRCVATRATVSVICVLTPFLFSQRVAWRQCGPDATR